MKKRLSLFVLLALFLGCLHFESFAQEDLEKDPDEAPAYRLKDHLFFGPSFNVSGANGILVAELSPYVGYNVNKYLGVGFWPFYKYYYQFQFKQGNSIYGGRVFGRANVHRNIRLHVEYESMNSFMTTTSSLDRQWFESLFVGGAYVQRLSERTSMNIFLLYNLSWAQGKSPYNSPLDVRFAFEIGR